jgi:hypothetical protein
MNKAFNNSKLSSTPRLTKTLEFLKTKLSSIKIALLVRLPGTREYRNHYIIRVANHARKALA